MPRTEAGGTRRGALLYSFSLCCLLSLFSSSPPTHLYFPLFPFSPFPSCFYLYFLHLSPFPLIFSCFSFSRILSPFVIDHRIQKTRPSTILFSHRSLEIFPSMRLDGGARCASRGGATASTCRAGSPGLADPAGTPRKAASFETPSVLPTSPAPGVPLLRISHVEENAGSWLTMERCHFSPNSWVFC